MTRDRMPGMDALFAECKRLRGEVLRLSDEHAHLTLALREQAVNDELRRGLLGGRTDETLNEAIVRVRDERNQFREQLAKELDDNFGGRA